MCIFVFILCTLHLSYRDIWRWGYQRCLSLWVTCTHEHYQRCALSTPRKKTCNKIALKLLPLITYLLYSPLILGKMVKYVLFFHNWESLHENLVHFNAHSFSYIKTQNPYTPIYFPPWHGELDLGFSCPMLPSGGLSLLYLQEQDVVALRLI